MQRQVNGLCCSKRDYHTIALSGKNTPVEREEAIAKLEQKERADGLDYIFTVDIFNDGWEFPGGKMKPGESREQALVREIQEELDTTISVKGFVKTVEYDYPQFQFPCKFLPLPL